ncbi:MAG: hypothetical protein E6G08_02645 [Actinobacteria bacterium]|nr:MAG: hypothetical protein E6G08_02645 [Actinomycetota bacterium]
MRTGGVATPSPGTKEASAVPIVEVKLYDKRVTEDSVPKIIEAMTNALAESSGAAKEHIQVLVEGVSPKNWGVGGEPQG